MKYQQKLAELAQRELPRLMDKLIIPDDRGFSVFGRYRIDKNPQGYVVSKLSHKLAVFRQARTALAWCIADRINNINLASQIVNLENISVRYHNDIEVRAGVGSKTQSGQQWETISHKLSRRKQQAASVDSELEKCIGQAKYYQIRGFRNETN